MLKITNVNELEKYISRYTMNELFTMDMKPYMELFFYKKNEHIVKDDEKMSCLIFLVSGKAKVYTTLSNGKSLLLCFYQDFKVLGDLEIIGSHNAVTNIQAIADSYCIGISFENVKTYLIEENALCLKAILYKDNSQYEVMNEKILIKLSADLYR